MAFLFVCVCVCVCVFVCKIATPKNFLGKESKFVQKLVPLTVCKRERKRMICKKTLPSIRCLGLQYPFLTVDLSAPD